MLGNGYVVVLLVLPARAGMSPSGLALAAAPVCAPRTGGDEP